MPPKAKPSAKGKAKAIAAPPPQQPTPQESAVDVLPFPVALAAVADVSDTDWAELVGCEEPSEAVVGVLRATLLLFGDPDAHCVKQGLKAVADRDGLLREFRALGPWGSTDAAVDESELALRSAGLGKLRRLPAAGSGASAAALLRPVKGKPAKGTLTEATPLPIGAAAAVAVGQVVESLVAERRSSEGPPGFPMSWPTDSLNELHGRLVSARSSRQHLIVACPSSVATAAVLLYFDRMRAIVCDVANLQVKVGLTQTLTAEQASAGMAQQMLEAVANGRDFVLLLGAAPMDLHSLCGSGPPWLTKDAFVFDKFAEEAAKSGAEVGAPGFNLVGVVEMTKAAAERVLPKVVPFFDEFAVTVVDGDRLPSHSVVTDAANERCCPSLRSAIKVLTLPVDENPARGSQDDVAETRDVDTVINEADFEFVETWNADWELRWRRGPATKDENGKEIKQNLIKSEITKYPSNPRDAKPCMQLAGGAQNAPCTGLWASFTPLARPSEIEFVFTMNGKVDLPNACVVFTQLPFCGALPECLVGVQFSVRGGMQLSGGGGNLVRISNDGKIQNDKWCKVLLKIDWKDKAVIAQVDTKGKGYAPAVQTVPFRDNQCQGFGYVYIYNTDVQATCWFHSFRVKQAQGHAFSGLDTEGIHARAVLARRLQEREYQRAVDADMEVGMKMGAIKSTANHGMNLAEEQRANNSGLR